MKAAKTKVHQPPEGTGKADGHFHVYVFDVFNKKFMPGKSFDTIEKAASYQRHEQERIYTEQEADPELFDLPFISGDAALIDTVAKLAEYREQLMKDLATEARTRQRRR